MQIVVFVFLFFVIVPTHFLLDKLLKKRRIKSKVVRINLSGLFSILLWIIGILLLIILSSSLRGAYASAGGDLTVLPVFILFYYTLPFSFVYIGMLNLVLFYQKLKKKKAIGDSREKG